MAYYSGILRSIAVSPGRSLTLDVKPDWSIPNHLASLGAREISSIEISLIPGVMAAAKRLAPASMFFRTCADNIKGYATLIPELSRCEIHVDVSETDIERVLQAHAAVVTGHPRVCLQARLGNFIDDNELLRVAPLEVFYRLSVDVSVS